MVFFRYLKLNENSLKIQKVCFLLVQCQRIFRTRFIEKIVEKSLKILRRIKKRLRVIYCWMSALGWSLDFWYWKLWSQLCEKIWKFSWWKLFSSSMIFNFRLQIKLSTGHNGSRALFGTINLHIFNPLQFLFHFTLITSSRKIFGPAETLLKTQDK